MNPDELAQERLLNRALRRRDLEFDLAVITSGELSAGPEGSITRKGRRIQEEEMDV